MNVTAYYPKNEFELYLKTPINLKFSKMEVVDNNFNDEANVKDLDNAKIRISNSQVILDKYTINSMKELSKDILEEFTNHYKKELGTRELTISCYGNFLTPIFKDYYCNKAKINVFNTHYDKDENEITKHFKIELFNDDKQNFNDTMVTDDQLHAFFIEEMKM